MITFRRTFVQLFLFITLIVSALALFGVGRAYAAGAAQVAEPPAVDAKIVAAATAVIVGALFSALWEAFPLLKSKFDSLPSQYRVPILIVFFQLVAVGGSYLVCVNVTIPGVSFVCPSTPNDIVQAVFGGLLAFVGSQVYHASVNKPLADGRG